MRITFTIGHGFVQKESILQIKGEELRLIKTTVLPTHTINKKFSILKENKLKVLKIFDTANPVVNINYITFKFQLLNKNENKTAYEEYGTINIFEGTNNISHVDLFWHGDWYNSNFLKGAIEFNDLFTVVNLPIIPQPIIKDNSNLTTCYKCQQPTKILDTGTPKIMKYCPWCKV